MKKFRLLLAAMLAFVFNSGVWAQTKEAYAEVSTQSSIVLENLISQFLFSSAEKKGSQE